MLLRLEDYSKSHAERLKAILRNANIIRGCEMTERSSARWMLPTPPAEVPDPLIMPAWWYMIYHYKIHECHCESQHTVPLSP